MGHFCEVCDNGHKSAHPPCNACDSRGSACASCGVAHCSFHMGTHRDICGGACKACLKVATSKCQRCGLVLCDDHAHGLSFSHCESAGCPLRSDPTCALCGKSFCAAHQNRHPHAPQDVGECFCAAPTALACSRCQRALCPAHMRAHACGTGMCSRPMCGAAAVLKCACERLVCLDHTADDAHPHGRCPHRTQVGGDPCSNRAEAQCPLCKKWFCHKSRTLVGQITHLSGHGCGLSEIQRGHALGWLPGWTFNNASAPLWMPPLVDEGEDGPRLPAEYLGEMMRVTTRHAGPAILDVFVSLTQTEAYRSHAWTEPLGLLLAMKQAKHWAPLYRAFLASPPAKSCCCQILNGQILAAKDTLHVRKMDVFPLDMVEEAHTKPWEARLAKKFIKPVRGMKLILDPDDVHVIDISQVGVLGATEELIEVRKYVNLIGDGKAVNHATMLNWPTCSVLAINQKDRFGAGTTRMVTPCIGQSAADFRVRVLDLSYSEIQRGIEVVMAAGVDQRDIARALIGLVKGGTLPRTAVMAHEIALQDVKARFLYGVRYNVGLRKLEFDKQWWLSRRATKINAHLTVSELLCSTATILFIAEPRHARAMIPVTLLQLEEVADGEMDLADLFGDLGGAIQYGRLLAGANYIGPALRNNPVSGDWLKATGVWDVVKRLVPEGQSVHGTPIQSCQAKDLRMVLGDSPAYVSVAPTPPCHSATQAIQSPDAARSPEYQVLMKELFTVFLRMLTNCKNLGEISPHAIPRLQLHAVAQGQDGDDEDDPLVTEEMYGIEDLLK
ncbi:hypothetical protein WMF11_29545 [Sorangium sp. So ce295]|uniref:hypothetical protein n=1 Tax=Sorangium sp. So ce295 TaxID=3133295 RepID=UPI003F601A7A